MRFVALAVIAALLPLTAVAFATSPTPRQVAGDHFYSAVLNTPHHERDLVSGESHGQAGQPFMVANDGSATAFVVGCDDYCTAVRIELRAAGLPPIVGASTMERPWSATLNIPERYARSLSNFEVQISLDCQQRLGCYYRWGLLGGNDVPSLAARGLPPAPTDAELSAATAPAGALHWLSRPSGDDLRFFYPIEAWSNNRAGSAQLQCLVAADGALRCQAQHETPAGAGFGDAARRLSSLLRVDATDAAGQPTANRHVTIPVQFARPS
jgi:hypothetical protein